MTIAPTASVAESTLASRRHLTGRGPGLPRPPLRVLGRLVRFAAVGSSGVVVNLAVLAVVIHLGGHYLAAAILAAEVSILSNFALQERYVFSDRRDGCAWRGRLGRTVAYNNADALARLPLLALLVEMWGIQAVAAQAFTLAAAFLLRFLFFSRVVYPVSAFAEVR